MELLQSVFSLTLSTEGVYQGEPEFAVLAFAISSAFFGSLIVFMDLLIVKTFNKASFLKLSYAGWKGLLVFIMWGIGAGVGGLLGVAIGIFELNRIACVVVGTSWPLILPRLINTANSELSSERIEAED